MKIAHINMFYLHIFGMLKISVNNIKKSKNYDWEIIYKKYMQEYEGLLK